MNPDAVVFSESSKPFVIPTNLVADIDTPDDWVLAEWQNCSRVLHSSTLANELALFLKKLMFDQSTLDWKRMSVSTTSRSLQRHY